MLTRMNCSLKSLQQSHSNFPNPHCWKYLLIAPDFLHLFTCYPSYTIIDITTITVHPLTPIMFVGENLPQLDVSTIGKTNTIGFQRATNQRIYLLVYLLFMALHMLLLILRSFSSIHHLQITS